MSLVWKYFSKDSLGARCTLCDKQYKNCNSTGVLWKHLRAQHSITMEKETEEEINNPPSPPKKRIIHTSEGLVKSKSVTMSQASSACEFEPSGDESFSETEKLSQESADSSSSLLSSVTRGIESELNPTTSSQSQPKISTMFSTVRYMRKKSEQITHAIAKMIATDMLPVSFVHNEGFRMVMKVAEPDYQVPSRTTILRRLHFWYSEQKEKLKKDLEKYDYISLTTDTWTSTNCKSYITVTAHTITNDWTMKSVNLTTSEMSERHTAENLTTKMLSILQEWNIEKKICATVHDNATNITKSVTENRHLFGDSVPCFAHTLQLCINAGLDASDKTKTIIKTASNIVSHFHHSNVATEALKLRQKQLNVPDHKLIQRIKTRWNSTYYMFQRLIEQRQVVSAVLMDRNIINAKSAASLTLCEEDWLILECFVKVLEPFEKATTMLSAEKNVTLSMAKPLMNTLLENFLKDNDEDDDSIETFKSIVRQQIETKFFYNVEEGNLTIFDTTSLLDMRYINDVPENIKNLGRIYLEAKISQLQPQINLENKDEKCQDTKEVKTALDFLFPKTENEESSEVTLYMKEHEQNKTCSPLTWWKENQGRYPKLSFLAKKYLCIPATSTPSERVFSTAGNIISDKRNSLHPDNVDMLIFLHENRHMY